MEHKGKLELTWVGKYDDKVLEPRILVEDASFTRQPMKSTICIDFTSFERNAEFRLVED